MCFDLASVSVLIIIIHSIGISFFYFLHEHFHEVWSRHIRLPSRKFVYLLTEFFRYFAEREDKFKLPGNLPRFQCVSFLSLLFNCRLLCRSTVTSFRLSRDLRQPASLDVSTVANERRVSVFYFVLLSEICFINFI